MTTVCTADQMGPDGDGYGAKLECPSAHYGLMASALPWVSGEQVREKANLLPACEFEYRRRRSDQLLTRQLTNRTYHRSTAQFKNDMLTVKNVTAVLLLQRDHGEGTVDVGKDGVVNINYEISKKDQVSGL